MTITKEKKKNRRHFIQQKHHYKENTFRENFKSLLFFIFEKTKTYHYTSMRKKRKGNAGLPFTLQVEMLQTNNKFHLNSTSVTLFQRFLPF